MTSLPRYLQQLDAKLSALGTADTELMLLSELDGFLAGILVCPVLIMPREWLPVVLGQEDGSLGALDDEAALQETFKLVLEHYNAVSRDLQRCNGSYRPVFDIDTQHDETLWELWANGFGRAMELRPESWRAITRTDDEGATLALAGLTALVSLAKEEADHAYDQEKTAALTQAAPDLIPDWIETINLWRLRNTTDSGVTPAKSTKVGRNEPCPCGSARKHKKCCGSN